MRWLTSIGTCREGPSLPSQSEYLAQQEIVTLQLLSRQAVAGAVPQPALAPIESFDLPSTFFQAGGTKTTNSQLSTRRQQPANALAAQPLNPVYQHAPAVLLAWGAA